MEKNMNKIFPNVVIAAMKAITTKKVKIKSNESSCQKALKNFYMNNVRKQSAGSKSIIKKNLAIKNSIFLFTSPHPLNFRFVLIIIHTLIDELFFPYFLREQKIYKFNKNIVNI